MRMRNKSWAKPLLENCDQFVVQNPEKVAGHWKQLLKTENIHVEIGSGKGDYWIGMADMHLDCGWVGIEKNANVAAIAVKKRIKKPNEHTKFIVADASKIEQWFNPGEISVIHLNFSDPWPKKGHGKRRLSHSDFLKKYEILLQEEGTIIIKTDNCSLFEFSLLEFAQQEWLLTEVNVDFRRTAHADIITEYEQKFIDLNQPIY